MYTTRRSECAFILC